MYESHWQLDSRPFENYAEERFYYPSESHQGALLKLRYVVENRRGGAVLAGEAGLGKTLLVRALENQLPENIGPFVHLLFPDMPADQLLSYLAAELGGDADHMASVRQSVRYITDVLARNTRDGRHALLAIDEAHVINNQGTLDELRMLLNLQRNEEFLITLILLGQPPLLNRVDELQPLKERISVKFNLTPLEEKDTLRYIVSRLKNAGAGRGFFTSEAIAPLYEYSGGIPLRINNVCDRCLLIGYMQRSWLIDTRIVADAIDDLQ